MKDKKLCVSGPLVDPGQAGRRRTSDWLVIVKAGARVEVHRFASRREADAFIYALKLMERES
jgi:hypothetical protein